ncbi:MAG: glucose-6-phosphate dehydrogenase assembly protein OpcA [Cyanobacteria bacterium P01_E01_bin.48]
MDRASAVLPIQSPKDVSVASIQAELENIWSSSSSSVAARASTFNIIVYEALDNTNLFPSEAVEAFATQNPCRVIDLRSKSDGDANSPLEAQVAAYCPVDGSSSGLVCCEYVTLQAPEAAFERACSTISSLLIPDLSAYLWWRGDLDLDSSLFQQLVSISHRVIVDSSTFVNPEEDLQEMHLLVRQGNYCGDLNWRRLNSWQELTAQAFDPPERRASLGAIDRVTIDYNSANPCQAMLYLGWLASRLSWEPRSRTQRVEHDYAIDDVTFRSNAGIEIQVELAAVPTAAATPGELTGLRLNSSDLNADACTVLCSETTGCMRMEVMGGAQSCRIQQVSSVDRQETETLLAQQLQRVGNDQLYEESIAMVERILNAPLPS